MKPIYLEPDEEITSVIDKIAALSDRKIAIVVPKNSTLFQSLINLKLLAKEAKEHDKEIAIISTNRVGQRLAEQVGFQAYQSLGSVAPDKPAEASTSSKPKPASKTEKPASETIVDGIRVNQYSPDVPVTPVPADEPGPVMEEPSTDATIAVDQAGEAADPEVPTPLVAEPPAEEKIVEKAETAAEPEEPSSSPAELPPIIPRSIRVDSPREPFIMPWKAVAAASGLLLILFVILYFFLPKATVVITFPATALNQSVDLNVSTTASENQAATVPGNLLAVEKSDKKTFTATGKKDVGSKATGNLTFYNKASSSSITLSSGTTATASGKNFTLDKAVTIPGASVSGGNVVPGQATGTVSASVAGDGYNLSNAQFSISGQPALVYATGSTTGGTTKQVNVLNQSDVDTAVTDLKKGLLEQATAELKTKAESQTITDASIWQNIKNQTVDQTVGAQVDNATLSLSVEMGVIAFDQTVAINTVKTLVSQDIKSEEELIVPPEKPITFTFKSLNGEKTAMVLTSAVQGFVVQKIDKNAIAKSVAHQSKNKAKTLLTDKYQATSVEVTLTPSWWFSQLPYLPQAIKIEHGFNEQPPITP